LFHNEHDFHVEDSSNAKMLLHSERLRRLDAAMLLSFVDERRRRQQLDDDASPAVTNFPRPPASRNPGLNEGPAKND
jgi:hypothetical protein